MDRIDQQLNQLANCRVLVLGLARSGVAAAKLLRKRGATVTGIDRQQVDSAHELEQEGVRLYLGQEPLSLLTQSDLLVLSPGVRLDHPMVLEAKARNVPIVGELELAFRLARVPTLAVTGTNGKSTTTALCAHLLRHGGFKVFLGGNIGIPFCNLLLEEHLADWAVIEVSSYQLEHLTSPEAFVPQIGVWLNLTPDHLERHHNMEAYASCKRRLFEGQGPAQTGVFFVDDPTIRGSLDGLTCRIAGFGRNAKALTSDGMLISGRALQSLDSGECHALPPKSLLGGHNAENAAAAVLAARSVGVEARSIQEGLETFPGLPHRLELVEEISGVRYFNDSKGTNIDATVKSLSSFDSPIVLIAGGRGKGAPYLSLRPLVSERVRDLILLGEDAPRLAQDLEGCAPLHRVGTMAQAVQLASQLAKSGDVVLLSPACASFDMFKDFAERGEVFSRLVRMLRATGQGEAR